MATATIPEEELRKIERMRKGRFSIPASEYSWLPGPEHYAVMAEVFVTRCEYIFNKDTFEYHAISPHFDIVPEGERMPEYTITIHEKGGKYDVSFNKVLEADSNGDQVVRPSGKIPFSKDWK